MHRFLFTNTSFEEELTSPLSSPIEFLQRYPIHLHLHYLSFLVADETETPLLYLPPEDGYLKKLESLGLPCNPPAFLHLNNLSSEESSLHSFGASESLALWAKKNRCLYEIPPLDLVKTINSKEFSFYEGLKLQDAEILVTEADLSSWWMKVKGPKVLKTLHGFSGRGHFISKWDGEDLESALSFFRATQKSSKGLLAEPWVTRVLDFSSQWDIQKNGSYSYLGSTICLNSPRGVYRKSFTGLDSVLFREHLDFFKEHLFHAEKVVKKIALLGFFGNLGFDAMLYRSSDSKDIKVHPIVEINARKTMGFVALKIHKKLQWEEPMSFSFEMKKTRAPSYLPLYALTHQGTHIPFKAQLLIEKKKDPISLLS